MIRTQDAGLRLNIKHVGSCNKLFTLVLLLETVQMHKSVHNENVAPEKTSGAGRRRSVLLYHWILQQPV